MVSRHCGCSLTNMPVCWTELSVPITNGHPWAFCLLLSLPKNLRRSHRLKKLITMENATMEEMIIIIMVLSDTGLNPLLVPNGCPTDAPGTRVALTGYGPHWGGLPTCRTLFCSDLSLLVPLPNPLPEGPLPFRFAT